MTAPTQPIPRRRPSHRKDDDQDYSVELIGTQKLLEGVLPAQFTFERFLAASGLVGAGMILLDLGGFGSAIFKLAVWFALPGWIIVRRYRPADPAARLAWILVSSAVVAAGLSLLMVWLELWHPRPAAAAVLVGASALLIFKPVSPTEGLRAPFRSRNHGVQRGFPGIAPWLLLVVALSLWVSALARTDTSQLGELGLLAEFPITWYLAVTLVLVVAIWGVCARSVASSRLMTAATTVLVVMLYTSASLVSEVPRLPWVYKHIAVTDLIGAVGRVDPLIDIYNRWPGFFSASAFLGEAVGYRDALAYAAWAEAGFALIDVMLLLAITRAISSDPRIQWTATLVFTLANWVNQNYYSPQALAFTLYLAICLGCLTYLRGTPVLWVRNVENRLRRRRRHRASVEVDDEVHKPRVTHVILGIVALFGVMVASHQLSPYLALLGFLPLFAFGYFRPRWLGPVLLGIALAYLIPNLEFIEQKYGIFTGFDIVSNSQNTPALQPASEAARVVAYAAPALSVLTGVLAVAGYARRIVRGHLRTTLTVAWLAFAPLIGVLGQSYGGEARFRIYLFALPWLAVGVAWLLWSGARTARAVVAAVASLTVLAILFTMTYFYAEAGYRVPKEEVTAAQWLNSAVQSGDMVFETNYFFPLLIGSNYPTYLQWGTNTPLSEFIFESPDFSPEDVEEYAKSVRDSEVIWVVFSDTQQKHAVAQQGLEKAQALPRLERELAATDNVTQVFHNESVRIYRIATSQ